MVRTLAPVYNGDLRVRLFGAFIAAVRSARIRAAPVAPQRRTRHVSEAKRCDASLARAEARASKVHARMNESS